MKAKAKKTGRPSAYRPEFTKQAYHLALLGATDADIARALGVSDTTIDNWKRQHPEFLGSLKAGKDQADANVAKSLYRRALGYSHPAVKIITVARGGNAGSDVEEVPYTERYAPDTTAAIFWLKNRRPDLWRDKHDLEHSGEVKGTGVLAVPVPLGSEQWATTAAAQQAQLIARPSSIVS
jgi:transposase-like protein